MTENTQPITRLGIILAFTAGALNAGGFLAVGFYTSHMTGIASAIADDIALHRFHAASVAAAFLLSFILGAAATALIVNIMRARSSHNEYAPALMFEGVLLLAFNLFASGLLAVMWLCFVMGVQNAIITKISNARIRTTHITGLVTDIGIELGRTIYRLMDPNSKGTTHNASLYLWMVSAFISGGIIGAIAFKAIGLLFTVPLALILVWLAWDMDKHARR